MTKTPLVVAFLSTLISSCASQFASESAEDTLTSSTEALMCGDLGESQSMGPCASLCRLVESDEVPEATADVARPILATALEVDQAANSAQAVLSIAPGQSKGLSVRVGDLDIVKVESRCGALKYANTNGQLDIGTPRWATSITVTYKFKAHQNFDGWMPSGSTLTWPYFQENLFPSRLLPSEGMRFSLRVRGVPENQKLIAPEVILAAAPSYMLAWAVGDYVEKSLGRTRFGTDVSVWYLPGQADAAAEGTARLKDAFEFFEQWLGRYSFGRKVGSISVNWGTGASGGMEHHPYWHVAADALSDKTVHFHEAAHGWFGNGIRLQCWEDFVLSEGTAEYLTARAVRATQGASAEAELWNTFRARLDDAVQQGDTQALPDSTCNKIDIYSHPIWSSIPSMKGAFFYRALEKAVGTQELDRALARFYRRSVGKAARMQDLLDAVKADTRFDSTALANAWLRSLGVPAEKPE
jgi:hypothetical protein